MTPRFITVILLLLLALLQYPLWFGKGGLIRVHDLSTQIKEQNELNDTLRLRNQELQGDVRSLTEGYEAIEERARGDFGMIKKDEVLIQLVEPDDEKGSGSNASSSQP